MTQFFDVIFTHTRKRDHSEELELNSSKSIGERIGHTKVEKIPTDIKIRAKHEVDNLIFQYELLGFPTNKEHSLQNFNTSKMHHANIQYPGRCKSNCLSKCRSRPNNQSPVFDRHQDRQTVV